MIFIKRIITIASSVIGSLFVIILLAVINSFANTGLTGGQVVLYGLIGGVAVGLAAGSLLTYYVVRKTKKLIFNRLAGIVGRLSFLRKV